MKKKEDIIIITWRFCKDKQFYHLSEIRTYLESLNYQKDIIDFAVSLAKESSYKLKDERLSLKADSYINLLNYDEVQLTKKSVKYARYSIWFSIIALIISIAIQFVKIEPIKTYNFWNSKIEAKKIIYPIYKHITKAPQANTENKALSKSLQSQRTEKNCFKKFADSLKKQKTLTHKPTEKKQVK